MKRYSAVGSLEVGVSIFMIFVVMGVIVYNYNPVKTVGTKRNNQRTEDVAKILNGITQYTNEHDGTIPVGIPISDKCELKENEMCKSNAADCNDKVFLQDFSNIEKYLVSIPVDPKSTTLNGTGYNVVVNDSGKITVCAPMSELGKNISISN